MRVKRLSGILIAASFALVCGCSIVGQDQDGASIDNANTIMGKPSASVYDEFSSFNSAVWSTSSGYGNGSPFNCCWMSDHITYSNSTMNIALDNTPNGGYAYTSGELKSLNLYSYGSFEARFKPAKISGIVAGSFFTYTGPVDNQPWDEIDIEFIGSNSSSIQVNYYVNGVGGHEKTINLGFDASSDYHNYKFVWSSKSISWYVDGVKVYTVTGSSRTLPSHSGRVMMNLWNGDSTVTNWLGDFSYSAPIYASYDWVKIN
jgi:beta-glucanase (GH16 family)